MKTSILSFILCAFFNLLTAQHQWFQTYTDSIALIKDAEVITKTFNEDIIKINPTFEFKGAVILDTSPYIIYYGLEGNVHLSLWEQLPPEIQGFFTGTSADTIEASKFFGLFFNGFYLPHELGHALQSRRDGKSVQSYDAEYDANVLAMLWWRKQGNEKELEQCYDLSKKILEQIPNPVPKDETIQSFFTKNYESVMDPSVYGYMQFTQFIEIYEDRTLPDFDTYVGNYLKKK